MDITYRKSIITSEKEIHEIQGFANQMNDLAAEDLGSLNKIQITKAWVIFYGVNGYRKFKRYLFGGV